MARLHCRTAPGTPGRSRTNIRRKGDRKIMIYLVMIAAVLALSFAAFNFIIVKRMPEGNEKMQEIRNKMEEEVNKLNTNKNIAEFMAAMEAFNEIMEGVNSIVTSYISPRQEGGCTGNCGSCGGCH